MSIVFTVGKGDDGVFLFFLILCYKILMGELSLYEIVFLLFIKYVPQVPKAPETQTIFPAPPNIKSCTSKIGLCKV